MMMVVKGLRGFQLSTRLLSAAVHAPPPPPALPDLLLPKAFSPSSTRMARYVLP